MSRSDAALAVSQVLSRLYKSLDLFDADQVSSCFHADAVWLRQGARLEGSEAVRQAMEERKRSVHVQHVISNLLLDFVGEEEVRVEFLLTLYLHDFRIPSARPAPLTRPAQVGPCDATFTRRGEEWRLSYMALAAPFFKA